MRDLVLGPLVLQLQQSAIRRDRLALATLLQLLQGRGAQVGQVVGARVRDDGVPDHGLVHDAVVDLGGPFGGDVHEELLRVPGEEGGQVGVEGELDDGVLFLLGGVVVGTALDSVDAWLAF